VLCSVLWCYIMSCSPTNLQNRVIINCSIIIITINLFPCPNKSALCCLYVKLIMPYYTMANWIHRSLNWSLSRMTHGAKKHSLTHNLSVEFLYDIHTLTISRWSSSLHSCCLHSYWGWQPFWETSFSVFFGQPLGFTPSTLQFKHLLPNNCCPFFKHANPKPYQPILLHHCDYIIYS